MPLGRVDLFSSAASLLYQVGLNRQQRQVTDGLDDQGRPKALNYFRRSDYSRTGNGSSITVFKSGFGSTDVSGTNNLAPSSSSGFLSGSGSTFGRLPATNNTFGSGSAGTTTQTTGYYLDYNIRKQYADEPNRLLTQQLDYSGIFWWYKDAPLFDSYLSSDTVQVPVLVYGCLYSGLSFDEAIFIPGVYSRPGNQSPPVPDTRGYTIFTTGGGEALDFNKKDNTYPYSYARLQNLSFSTTFLGQVAAVTQPGGFNANTYVNLITTDALVGSVLSPFSGLTLLADFAFSPSAYEKGSSRNTLYIYAGTTVLVCEFDISSALISATVLESDIDVRGRSEVGFQVNSLNLRSWNRLSVSVDGSSVFFHLNGSLFYGVQLRRSLVDGDITSAFVLQTASCSSGSNPDFVDIVLDPDFVSGSFVETFPSANAIYLDVGISRLIGTSLYDGQNYTVQPIMDIDLP